MEQIFTELEEACGYVFETEAGLKCDKSWHVADLGFRDDEKMKTALYTYIHMFIYIYSYSGSLGIMEKKMETTRMGFSLA